MPNHEANHKNHVETTVENIKKGRNTTERYYQKATESKAFDSMANISMQSEHSNIIKNIKNQNLSRYQDTSFFITKCTEMND